MRALVLQVWRVQNVPLYNFYAFHKTRLEQQGVDVNELSLWHGTSSLDPAMIYNDPQDGFMMQFARAGFWGRGIVSAAAMHAATVSRLISHWSVN